MRPGCVRSHLWSTPTRGLVWAGVSVCWAKRRQTKHVDSPHNVEIKLGTTIDPRSLAGLKQCMSDLGLKRGWVVNTAEERRMLSPGIEQVPWQAIVAGEVKLF